MGAELKPEGRKGDQVAFIAAMVSVTTKLKCSAYLSNSPRMIHAVRDHCMCLHGFLFLCRSWGKHADSWLRQSVGSLYGLKIPINIIGLRGIPYCNHWPCYCSHTVRFCYSLLNNIYHPDKILVAILTLQPTNQPQTKAEGLDRHALASYSAFPLAFGGVSAAYYNKELLGKLHTQTWHAVRQFLSCPVPSKILIKSRTSACWLSSGSWFRFSSAQLLCGRTGNCSEGPYKLRSSGNTTGTDLPSSGLSATQSSLELQGILYTSFSC